VWVMTGKRAAYGGHNDRDQDEHGHLKERNMVYRMRKDHHDGDWNNMSMRLLARF